MLMQRVDARLLSALLTTGGCCTTATEMRYEVGKVLCEVEKILRQVGKVLCAILESPVRYYDATDAAIG